MENNSDTTEVEHPEFGDRVHRYFVGQLSSEASISRIRARIAEGLREQEDGLLTNASGNPGFALHTSETEVKEYPSPVGLPKVRRQSQPRRFSWSLAVAATAILTVGVLVVGFLGMGRGMDVGNLFGHKEQVVFSEGFENGLENWAFSENQPSQYDGGIDNSTYHSGKASTYIESAVDEPINSAHRGRKLDVKDYLDKRIRFSGFVKTNSNELTASIEMFVFGEPMLGKDGQSGYGGYGARILGRDNMADRLIHGKVEWQKYDIVLDIPPDAEGIYISLTIEGKGRVWFDDITLSVADDDVPVTNLYRFAEPGNVGFEQGLTRWGSTSTMSRAYELGIDEDTKYEGNASGVLSSTYDTAQGNVFYYLVQNIRTDNYKGKKVRFSAQIKTENVEDKATFWVGVRDLADAPMSPNTSGSVERKGTTDWQKYEAEIDVPDDSLYFLMFIGLQGKGKMWIDDVRLEVVGDYVPATLVKP